MSTEDQPPGPVTSWRQVLPLLKPAAPLHPILVHLTIGLVSGAFFFDLVTLIFGAEAVAEIGWWLLAAATVVTVLTLATGVIARRGLPVEESESRSFLRLHMALGPIFFGLLILTAVWRGSLWEAGLNVSWGYVAMLAITVVVMTVQGFLGGELVYRYGMDVEGTFPELPGHAPQEPGPSLPEGER
ncbi:MAG: DUF2231 domain-containing protein [Bradymonadaceae bacterium]